MDAGIAMLWLGFWTCISTAVTDLYNKGREPDSWVLTLIFPFLHFAWLWCGVYITAPPLLSHLLGLQAQLGSWGTKATGTLPVLPLVLPPL